MIPDQKKIIGASLLLLLPNVMGTEDNAHFLRTTKLLLLLPSQLQVEPMLV